MTKKKILEIIIKNDGLCSTLDNCQICPMYVECNVLLDKHTTKHGNLVIPMEKYLSIKKEVAINKYIELYGKEDLMEVLL